MNLFKLLMIAVASLTLQTQAQAHDNNEDLENLLTKLNRIERSLDKGNVAQARKIVNRAQNLVFDMLDQVGDESPWTCSMSHDDFNGLVEGHGDTEKQARTRLLQNCINRGVNPAICKTFAMNEYLSICTEL